MIASFLVWLRARSVREQRLLLLMFALLTITIIWLGIYRPLQDMLSRARERQQEAAIRLGDVEAGAAAFRLSLGAPAAGLVLTVVTQSAAEAGFANATIAPRGDRRVWVLVPSARPAPFFAWVAALESRGIVVEQLSARTNGDQTLAVDVTFGDGR